MSNLLRVKIGDIRDPEALNNAMTDDVVGVVHLASVSRVLWCLENEADCLDVNERGTDVVLNALSDLNVRDGRRRWFVLASSREVYGNSKILPVSEDDEKLPANVYGASKLRAEQVLEKHIEFLKQSGTGSLHAMALRLSNVYGGVHDHVERLIPSIITQALSHQVIQIVGGEQNFDLLHIDDCTDAFLLAITRLTERTENWMARFSRASLRVYNIASGSEGSVDTLIDTIVRFTESKSGIRYIPGDDRYPKVYRGSAEKARRELGFQAAVPLKEGLLRLTRLHLQRSERGLTGELEDRGCASPRLHVNVTDLLKLNNCEAHVTVDVQGQLAVLTAKDNEMWMAVDKLPPALNRIYVKEVDGKAILSVQDPDQGFWLGVDTSNHSLGPVGLHKIGRDDIAAEASSEWEMEVNQELGTVRLIPLSSPYQLKAPVQLGDSFSLASREEDIWPFRVTPVCCAAPAPWPFSEDDPIFFMTEYQKTSVERPFLASSPRTMCARLRRARSKVRKELAALSMKTLDEPRRKESSKPSEWANAHLPACSNVCTLPAICVDTGDCQCVLSSCDTPHRFPFSMLANHPTLSFPPPQNHTAANPLVAMMERSSWRNVLRPQASRFISTGNSWPIVKVGPLGEEFENSILSRLGGFEKVHKLHEMHCFSADSQMQRALSLLEGEITGQYAEFTWVPYFQGSGDKAYMIETYDYLRNTAPNFNPNHVIIPFAHDWGGCLDFEWEVWTQRKKRPIGINPYLRSTMQWTVMADLNSPCYRPHQDVVIPPRTCLSPKLFEAFEDVSRVRPARDRRVLATFKGTNWGTGAMMRSRLMCNNRFSAISGTLDGLPGRRLLGTTHPIRPLWGSQGDYPSYMGLLNDTIFCPHAAGTTGWATRLVDSVCAGCVPVLIGHAAHFPFFDVIDWRKISVRIETAELDRVEEVLVSRYSLEDVERLQANLMLVRNAFVYPLDDEDDSVVREKMVARRGPLFFALHSAGMRALTKWPTDEVYDRP
ncbi:hypothetical protein FRB97_007421 [Tulasnella sp. 331]|nr:hypothetical protein FRB97_007421 [Tulasnella sp. 331]